MIQNKLRSLNTKVKGHFYGMAKTRIIMINIVKIVIIIESLL